MLDNKICIYNNSLQIYPADECRLRERIVEIGAPVYRPLRIPQQIEELFCLILDKAGAITDPFEQAF